MKLLIDGDHLVYSCGFAADKHNEGIRAASYNISNQISKIIAGTHVHEYQIYLTGKGNFRNEIATLIPYKGNRVNNKKPKTYDKLREYLVKVYNAIIVDGMEADDAVAIEQTKNTKFDSNVGGTSFANTTLVSIDKDLDQVPGWHYNYIKKKTYFIDEFQGEYNYYSQVLSGDRCDNIPGLYGYGKVKINKVFKGCKTHSQFVVKVWDEYMNSVKNNKLRLTLGIIKNIYNKEYDIPLILNEIKDLLWIKRNEI